MTNNFKIRQKGSIVNYSKFGTFAAAKKNVFITQARVLAVSSELIRCSHACKVELDEIRHLAHADSSTRVFTDVHMSSQDGKHY